MQGLPRFNYIICNNTHEDYRMFYTTWGSQDSNRILLCVHGLGRNSRDWDYVGQYFAKQGYYVIAPDIVGHGNSGYLTDPTRYSLANCVQDLLNLVKTLSLTNINFIGTSMGGLLGISLAANTTGLLHKLVLNDIGAELERSGVARIMHSYHTEEMEFDSFILAREYLINSFREWGYLSEVVWENFAQNSVQKNAQGKYVVKRDINIGKAFNRVENQQNLELWHIWEKVTLPTLVIRGERSDILSRNTVQKMQKYNPQAVTHEITNTGHAPFLYNDIHCELLNKFLN